MRHIIIFLLVILFSMSVVNAQTISNHTLSVVEIENSGQLSIDGVKCYMYSQDELGFSAFIIGKSSKVSIFSQVGKNFTVNTGGHSYHAVKLFIELKSKKLAPLFILFP